jgi:error-prone DNA polymerase
VVDLIKSLRVRARRRGSGAGSLVTYLLGISDVDPIRYGLLMERFLSPLRHQLPDIDIDVESARGWRSTTRSSTASAPTGSAASR